MWDRVREKVRAVFKGIFGPPAKGDAADFTWEPPSSEKPDRRIHSIDGSDLIHHSERFDVSERFSIPPRMLIMYISRPVPPDTTFEEAAAGSAAFQVMHIHPFWLDMEPGVDSDVAWQTDAIYSTFVFPDESRIEIKADHEENMRTDGERFLWVEK